MVRSTLLVMAVASATAVLATSVVTPSGVGSPAVATVVQPHPATTPQPERELWPGLKSVGQRGAEAVREPRVEAVPEPASGQATRWRWPLRPRPAVLRRFRAPESTYGAGHRGVDLSAAVGVPVLAVEAGTVTHAGLVAGRGTVTVQHAGGLSSTYEPLTDVVAVGTAVTTGDMVGTLRARDGPGHCGPRACLHLGARRGSSYLDPYPLLAAGRLALLPLRE